MYRLSLADLSDVFPGMARPLIGDCRMIPYYALAIKGALAFITSDVKAHDPELARRLNNATQFIAESSDEINERVPKFESVIQTLAAEGGGKN